jgi:replicative superfamily II helicase
MPETILWSKLTDAVEAFKILKNERNEKDDINTFLSAFKTAATKYASLNNAEEKEFTKMIIARHQDW